MKPEILFPPDEIAARVNAVAADIASLETKPDIAAPILAGAFVFAADLLRALSDKGVMLPVEFLWLRSYGNARTGGALETLVAPTEQVRGKTVLLIDGVLDSGETIAKARTLLIAQGARAVQVVVAVDKQLPNAKERADYSCFKGVRAFIAGYGMDDQGGQRGLPYIGTV